MDKIKIILVIIAVILGSLGLFVAIGFIYSLLFYAFVLAVIGLGGYIAFKLFVKPEEKQLKAPDPKKQLEKVQRLLDEYKRE
jgi:amino acid permease